MHRLESSNDKNYIFSSRIQKILDFVKNNYKKPIPLERASKIIGLSPFHFTRIFKKDMGITFKKYLNLYRILKAAIKLREGNNLLVTDICFESGFRDFSNFIRQFKIFIGCTPQRFKDCKGNPKHCALRKQSLLIKYSNFVSINNAVDFPIVHICLIKRAIIPKK
jgi:AraC-like DNA-binding protein